MKKLCIFIGLVSSLHGAEHNLTLRTRASNVWSSIQTRWPLNMALASCGILVAYVGYKALMHHRTKVKTHDTFEQQDNAALIKVMGPYFHAYKYNNFALSEIIMIAAQDTDVVSLLPKESEHYPVQGPAGSYLAPREEYLLKNVFTRSNVDSLVIEPQNQVAQSENVLGKPTFEFNNDGVPTYTYILSDDDVKKVEPVSFFGSTQFLEHKVHDASLNIDFKSEDMRDDKEGYMVRLDCRKNNSLISHAKIFDFRAYFYKDYEDKYKKPGAQSSERTLKPDELMALNREYIKQRYVMAGGKLYIPTQNKNSMDQKPPIAYAWYNPLSWFYKK
jgi:hypothetical protein